MKSEPFNGYRGYATSIRIGTCEYIVMAASKASLKNLVKGTLKRTFYSDRVDQAILVSPHTFTPDEQPV